MAAMASSSSFQTIVSSIQFHAFASSSSPFDSRVSANLPCRIGNRHSSSRSLCASIIRFRPTLISPLMGKKKASLYPSRPDPSSNICRAAEYKFPDPIPEFADAEIDKFKTHMVNKLSKRKDVYGDSLDEVLGICIEIFTTFMHGHYGGPGTLLVIPFCDMNDTINERGLPGGPKAARAAVKWATIHVDKDWKEWHNNNNNE